MTVWNLCSHRLQVHIYDVFTAGSGVCRSSGQKSFWNISNWIQIQIHTQWKDTPSPAWVCCWAAQLWPPGSSRPLGPWAWTWWWDDPSKTFWHNLPLERAEKKEFNKNIKYLNKHECCWFLSLAEREESDVVSDVDNGIRTQWLWTDKWDFLVDVY